MSNRYISDTDFGLTGYHGAERDFRRKYLQNGVFVDAVTNSVKEVPLAISRHSRELVGTLEELGQQNIHTAQVLESSTRELQQANREEFAVLKGEMREEFDALSESLDDGFEMISLDIQEVSKGVAEGNRLLFWGFRRMISDIGCVNDSLKQLVAIAKTPAQTWAYNQFEIAKDCIRRELYPEAFEALTRAINGFGDNTGYKTEFRFHYTLGTLYLGDVRDEKAHGILDFPKAEEAFNNATRYSRKDFPKEASVACAAAGWAALCQGRLEQALDYTQQAISLNPDFAEAHFQLAKILMHQDKSDDAIPSLRRAIVIELKYLFKALGDPDFKQHQNRVDQFLEVHRLELRDQAAKLIEEAKRSDEKMLMWQAIERAGQQYTKARQALGTAAVGYANGTLLGAVTAKTSAQEAIHLSEEATKFQIEGMRKEISTLESAVEHQWQELKQDALECAPDEFAKIQSKFTAMTARQPYHRSYANARECLQSFSEIETALVELKTIISKRIPEIRAENDLEKAIESHLKRLENDSLEHSPKTFGALRESFNAAVAKRKSDNSYANTISCLQPLSDINKSITHLDAINSRRIAQLLAVSEHNKEIANPIGIPLFLGFAVSFGVFWWSLYLTHPDGQVPNSELSNPYLCLLWVVPGVLAGKFVFRIRQKSFPPKN